MKNLLIRKFKVVCMAEEEYFDTVIPRVTISETARPYWFKDNGSKVLAVAHVDSVCPVKHFGVIEDSETKWVLSPTLDDRAGVHVVTNILPHLGIETDILLATDEERGQSTAGLFEPPKDYNWIVEFDRKGDDYVLYDYKHNAEWLKALAKHFPKKGFGSASDISKMGRHKVCAVNVGVGYEDYHTKWARLDAGILMEQIYRFRDFYNEFKDVSFVHEIPEPKVYAPANNYAHQGYRNCTRCHQYRYCYANNMCYGCGQVATVVTSSFPKCDICDSAVGIIIRDNKVNTCICLNCVDGKADIGDDDDDDAIEAPLVMNCEYCGEEALMDEVFDYFGALVCLLCIEEIDVFECCECKETFGFKDFSPESIAETTCINCMEKILKDEQPTAITTTKDNPASYYGVCDWCDGDYGYVIPPDSTRLCYTCRMSNANLL